MIAVAILAFLVGAVLGMRWRVLILLPTSASIAAAAIAFDLLMSHAGLAATVSDLAVILFAHQTGYLFGALVRGYFSYGERTSLVARARV